MISAPVVDKIVIQTCHLHSLWTCPKNLEYEDEAIVASNKYIQQAVAEADSCPCLWLRGIMPASRVGVAEPDTQLNLHFSRGAARANNWPAGTYFGDGTGGRYTSVVLSAVAALAFAVQLTQ